jgi:hypothetical protein
MIKSRVLKANQFKNIAQQANGAAGGNELSLAFGTCPSGAPPLAGTYIVSNCQPALKTKKERAQEMQRRKGRIKCLGTLLHESK